MIPTDLKAPGALREGLPPAASPTLHLPPLGSLRNRGWPLLAWLVIIGLVGFVVYRQSLRKAAGEEASALVTMQMQARYLVGAASLNFPGASGTLLYEQARGQLDRGYYSERLRFAVVAGELVGPDEALKRLRQLESDRRAGVLDGREASIEAEGKLERLYLGYKKHPGRPSLSIEEQERLKSGLGWFGELALAPKGSAEDARHQALLPARRTVYVYFSAVGLGLAGLGLGGVLLLVFFILACLGKLDGGLTVGIGHGGVYAETFALYLLVFIVSSWLVRFLPMEPGSTWGVGLALMFLSLAVLAWPRLRGIPWRQIRHDIGLHLDGHPFTQIASGIACYLSALPFLLAGVVVMYAMMFAQKWLGLGDPFKPGAAPTHPIAGEALHGNLWLWVQLYLAACVAAPIVEEIMFRGVLYRHLREAAGNWSRAASILFSALVSGFVFAVIHPQGWLGVPVLMGLATAFALAREWRRSLLPSMIAHGINNGVTMTMLLLAAA
jgi:membrane protease YdiL (CAAX protease family)